MALRSAPSCFIHLNVSVSVEKPVCDMFSRCAVERVVGFDNERGKGDHKHFGDQEEPYTFVDVDRLIDDFIQEVERWKSEH